MKILLTDSHALGDAVEDIIAAWHLHRTHPEHQVNLDLGCFNPLTDNIGWLDRTVTRGNADKVIPIEMPLIHRSNQNCVHVVTAITRHLETCWTASATMTSAIPSTA